MVRRSDVPSTYAYPYKEQDHENPPEEDSTSERILPVKKESDREGGGGGDGNEESTFVSLTQPASDPCRLQTQAQSALRRKLFPRLVALRVAFPDWDDYKESGAWHTDFMMSRAPLEVLEDYRAILAVLPYPLHALEDKRTAICVLQGLDVLRNQYGTGFTPLSQNQLLSSTVIIPTSSSPKKLHEPRSNRTLPHDSDGSGGENQDASKTRSPKIKQHSQQEAQNLEGVARKRNDDETDESAIDSVPVDQYFPPRKYYKVFQRGSTEWTVMLKKPEKGSAAHLFVMQLLERLDSEEYLFYYRWGKEDDTTEPCWEVEKTETQKQARELFEEVFEQKTGNRWYGSVLKTLPQFTPVKGRYILVDDVSEHVSLALPLRPLLSSRRRHRQE